ncbi:MAG: prepilin-type N-terminal cleavage/methylation domain-containing protein [Verrucomicrobia bacterium]|nr:prepilin-type N-terminal cleavage/methylation domain-containing protein [Verrucomicrobiota bacterium]
MNRHTANHAAWFMNRRVRHGFTLLEICLVLFIIALVLGATIPLSSGYLTEEKLRRPARQLQACAKTARHLAILERCPYAIRFDAEGFSLHARASADGAPSTNEVALVHYPTSADIQVRLQRWDEDEWKKPRDQIWMFQPSGLCEPLRVQLSRGRAWLEISFHPLTASVQDESYSFP